MIAYRSGITLSGQDTSSYQVFADGTSLAPVACYQFQRQSLFNNKVIVGNKINNCASMLEYCTNFNSQVIIGKNVINCANMLGYCLKFNQNVVIPNSVINCANMFRNCYKFNCSILIPNSVNDCSRMFETANNFDSPITIPNGVTNCLYMFAHCLKLNSAITISDSVTNCLGTFLNCRNFNREIPNIPNSANDCSYMFHNCINLNMDFDIEIPESVTNCYQMFCYTNIGGNVYFLRDNLREVNIMSMLSRGTSGYPVRVINVYHRDLDYLKTSNIVGPVSNSGWTAVTNGYYNSRKKIYIYNNI